MEKSGLKLGVIGVVCFILVLFNNVTGVLLICGYAIFIVDDKALIRQTVSALMLGITYKFLSFSITSVFGWLGSLFATVDLYQASGAMYTVITVFDIILDIAIFAFVIFCIIQIISGKTVKIPFVDGFFVDGKFSIGNPKPAQQFQYQQPQSSQQPMSQPQMQNEYQAPTFEAVPEEETDIPEVIEETLAVETSEETWTCANCGNTNVGNFCITCGSKKGE